MDESSTTRLNQDNVARWDRRMHARSPSKICMPPARRRSRLTFCSTCRCPRKPTYGCVPHCRATAPSSWGAGITRNDAGSGDTCFRPFGRWHPRICFFSSPGVTPRGYASETIRSPFFTHQRNQNPRSTSRPNSTAISALEIPAGAWINYYGPPGTLPHCSRGRLFQLHSCGRHLQ